MSLKLIWAYLIFYSFKKVTIYFFLLFRIIWSYENKSCSSVSVLDCSIFFLTLWTIFTIQILLLNYNSIELFNPFVVCFFSLLPWLEYNFVLLLSVSFIFTILNLVGWLLLLLMILILISILLRLDLNCLSSVLLLIRYCPQSRHRHLNWFHHQTQYPHRNHPQQR